MNNIDPDGTIFFLAAPVLIGMASGAALDLSLQMIVEGKSINCINWNRVALGSAVGAVPGGAYMGAFKHSVSGMSWLKASRSFNNVSRRLKRFPVNAGKDNHHWLIPNNGWRKKVPNFIKNHPWNLNPLDPDFHRMLHRRRALPRLWKGAPDWGKGTMLGLGSTMVLPDLSDRCECRE